MDGLEMRNEIGPSEVQRKLLAEPPEMSAIDLAVSWRPFGAVGGDFYDFVALEENGLGITLGDISGKGYDAALLMVYTLAETRARLKEHQRLTYIMGQLDDSLRQFSGTSKYAEVLVGIYMPHQRRFIYVQGGKIFPVVFHKESNELRLYNSLMFRIPGIDVQHDPSRHFVEASVDLMKGDILILFTDGLGERVDRDGNEIVRKNDLDAWVAPSIKSICSDHGDGDSKRILGAIMQYLESLPNAPNDDETLIVLKAA